MTTTMSIRDLVRSGKKLMEYDYVDIEDKKRHEYKGLFVPKKYADEVKAFLQKRLEADRRKSYERIMRFSGLLDGATEGKTFQELKEKRQKGSE